MGPKKGGNPKAVEARERKEEKEKGTKQKEAKQKEDQFWAEAGEGSK